MPYKIKEVFAKLENLAKIHKIGKLENLNT
jgi:hypothetical protein